MGFIRTVLILAVFGIGMTAGGDVEAGASPGWLAFIAAISLMWVSYAVLAAWMQG